MKHLSTLKLVFFGGIVLVLWRVGLHLVLVWSSIDYTLTEKVLRYVILIGVWLLLSIAVIVLISEKKNDNSD